MIYLTGDTHIPIDIEKLNEKLFPEQLSMTREDHVIICGDFGGIWDESERHKKWLEWLAERNFTVLFADGNHENFTMLEKYPVSEWHGGKIHVIADNIFHLMRGQVFDIENRLFFVMGGAYSKDRIFRTPGVSWWAREMPDEEEYKEALRNLKKVGFSVDHVITHTAPTNIISRFYTDEHEKPLNEFLQYLADTLSFDKWFFGHVHTDEFIDDRFIVLYDRIYDLERNVMLEERCRGFASDEMHHEA
ncbi:MAG: metallophosphoesterase [Oscillospiraceae bacterium]|nr:metallophosphoesterase [Oscillospiraceae bacterium]